MNSKQKNEDFHHRAIVRAAARSTRNSSNNQSSSGNYGLYIFIALVVLGVLYSIYVKFIKKTEQAPMLQPVEGFVPSVQPISSSIKTFYY